MNGKRLWSIGARGSTVMAASLLLVLTLLAAFCTNHILLRCTQPDPSGTTCEEAFPTPGITAELVAYPSLVQVGASVFLDGRNSSSFTRIIQYEWTVTIGSETYTSYEWGVKVFRFDVIGNHTASLTVYDSASGIDSTSVVVNVVGEPVDNAPLAEAGPDWTAPPGTGVFLDGSRSFDDWAIVDYLWTFEDQGPQILHGMNPFYTFLNIGTFAINLTVTDAVGLQDSDTTTYSIMESIDIPVAEAGPNQTVNIMEEVTFDGSASTDDVGIIEYKWMFTDGGVIILYGINVTHTFNLPGDYVVSLTVTDSSYFTDSDYMVVHVVALPGEYPVAEAGEDATIEAGTTYQLDGTGSSDDTLWLDYVWNFKYNSTSQILIGPTPTFLFEIPGIYQVKLTVTDIGRQAASDIVTITVIERSDESAELVKWLVVLGVAAGAGLACLAAIELLRRRT